MNAIVVPEAEYAWLQAVHGVDLQEARVVILHGSQFTPEKIEVFAHDSHRAKPMRVYFPAACPEYTVTVSHLGQVYRGSKRQEALRAFHHFRSRAIARRCSQDEAQSEKGGAAGVCDRSGDGPVTLMRDHEIERAYRPGPREPRSTNVPLTGTGHRGAS
ncbi:hypothetical protein FFI97_025255 [Variovorax sp. KBS0712]|uniref:hypothetical protein n=1 Tax=Variovorax sp. KBS0712 TaxID=2578111 RepID=UPI0011192724|nr:hypothetical protein [Variovorax sp. KBS0712]TSD54685.1 hypothetical protein FFI97_025255 [Variovorax sp. KBS0712]